jgi:hypothetical protein
MSGWRDTILKEFPTQVARLTLVADPDGLLAEEGVLRGLRDRGFDLIEFEDSIAFRYAYESKYRAQWDRGVATDLVVVLRSQEQDLRNLPHDLYSAGRKLSFSIPAIFPNLSYPTVDALGAKHFDSLFRAQDQYKPARMGSNQTADFILLHVFETEPKLIRRPAQLLHFLMRKHYRKKEIPARLVGRFIEVLRQGGQFQDWPLEQIVANSADFYAFLQERWALRIHAETSLSENQVKEAPDASGLQYPGPVALPFEHDDVKVYLDNLFTEGLLKPVSVPSAKQFSDSWLHVGISKGVAEDRQRRLDHAQKKLAECLPDAQSSYQDWMAYSQALGDVRAFQHLSGADAARTSAAAAKDNLFQEWLQSRYGSLYNQPPVPPVMVHHIPKAMSASLSPNRSDRVALLVIDGMSLGQWALIREVLREQADGVRFEEQCLFAWIPTLTSVSRQAIFSGKLPQFFPESMYTTAKDGSLWRQFWAERGYASDAVQYLKDLGPAKDQELLEQLENDGVKVLGLVVNTIDDIMHGMVLGDAGMYSQVEQWARQGYLLSLLQRLLTHGFKVFITADHGNVEARGIGNPSEGAIAETHGQRVRIYSSPELRSATQQNYPNAVSWPQTGLPVDVFPLVAPSGEAFVNSGDIVVSHGGCAVEEVVVPFVAVMRAR